MADLKNVNEKSLPRVPNTAPESRAEVDATPTGESMQINVMSPVTSDRATVGSPMLESMRVSVAVGAPFQWRIAVLPRYWVIFVNRNSGVGAIAQIQSGGVDVSLIAGDRIKFPARDNTILLTATVATANATIFALGDQDVIF